MCIPLLLSLSVTMFGEHAGPQARRDPASPWRHSRALSVTFFWRWVWDAGPPEYPAKALSLLVGSLSTLP